MADWAIQWVEPLSDEELAKVQMTEHGGMNEGLFNLYALTGEKKYLDGGLRFEHKRFFDPLAARHETSWPDCIQIPISPRSSARRAAMS